MKFTLNVIICDLCGHSCNKITETEANTGNSDDCFHPCQEFVGEIVEAGETPCVDTAKDILAIFQ